MIYKRYLLIVTIIFSFISFTVEAKISKDLYNSDYTFDYKKDIEKRNNFNNIMIKASDAFNKKNKDLLENLLIESWSLEPYRLDVLHALASTQIWNSKLDEAIDTYKVISELSNNHDIDALIYLSYYLNLKHVDNTYYFNQLKNLNSSKATDVNRIINSVERALKTPVVDTLPKNLNNSEKLMILTLGFALKSDGSMDDILISRLNKTLEVAKEYPKAKIIVSGGVPKNNKNEAIEMKNWLVKQGLNSNRIFEENYALDTVENMKYSRLIFNQNKASDIIIITSGTHIRRSIAILDVMKWVNGDNYNIHSVAVTDKPISELQTEGKRTLSVYRGAIRAYGLPWMVSSNGLILK